ncbi:hypothetical protein J5N97_008998 [Dioscorea zingiberensis]|uniref:Uncharacterized protein n=1 Tax=Dioscorea zingiberensis TaxID=325984 RepID=A0A9D5CWS0_9LILI|nr:hypothetical protein J5N97_008998 [Dioscorea zingiberensis]
MSRKRKTPDMSMLRMGANTCSDENIFVTEKSEVTSVMASASKGDTPLVSKVRNGIDQNMDISTSSSGMRKCAKVSAEDTHKGIRGTELRHDHVDDEALTTTTACINDTCVSMEFSSRCQYDVSQASGVVDSERSLARESHGHDSISSNLDFKNSSAGTAIIEEKVQTRRHLASSPVAARKEDSLSLEQLSPTKALRAAMLKSRFADTIIKAQQKTLLNHGNKVDRVKMQREKENLEKQQQEEKVQIEAQVRAAEPAARKRAEDELKMQREKEREAARLKVAHKMFPLTKYFLLMTCNAFLNCASPRLMERTVVINDNYQTLKDLESLAYSLSGHQLDQMDRIQNSLEKLGLFMKHEELDEPDDPADKDGDAEEGEIGFAFSIDLREASDPAETDLGARVLRRSLGSGYD